MIMFFAALGLESLKKVMLLRGSDKSDILRKKTARMEIWIRLMNTMIFCLIVSRVILCLVAPPELMPFNYLSAELTHLLLTGLIFCIFWALIWYFGTLKSEIKIEERAHFSRQLLLFSAVLAVTDLLITLLLSIQGYQHMFTLQAVRSGTEISAPTGSYAPLLAMSLILLLLLITFYMLYIFKRSIKILKQYWLTLLLLLTSTLLFTILSNSTDLGWYDEGQTRLLIFSWQYAYFGWIYLIFISISLFCNSSSIVLLSVTNKFVNPVKYRNLSITFIKIGFVAAIAFTLLSIVPNFLLWIYT
jgi:hypothetical protein